MKRAIAATLLMLAGTNAALAGSTVFLGGVIYTLNDRQPKATALVVGDGHIVYVGGDRGAQHYVKRASRVVRLGGRMMLPGFHDAHAHPMSSGLRLLRCQLDGIKTEAKADAAIRGCDRTASEDWLFANGWSAKVSPPSLVKLDALVPERPAYIATTDGFAVWVNSRTLKAAGIDPASSSLAGLERNPRTHNPTGVVTGDALMQVRQFRPQPSEVQFREAFRRWSNLANADGITSVFDAAASPQMVDAYHAADLADDLTLRVVAAQLIDPKRGPEQIDEMVARRDRVRGIRFRADAAKIFLDGEISDHSAALLQPYAVQPDSRGELYVQTDALEALVRRLDAEGFMVHMHAMGDRAVRSGLDAIERAIAANGAKDRRHQIAHIELADPADLPRFGALDVSANLSPGWFSPDDPDMEPSEKALGPARAHLMYPAASIALRGGRIVMSSDWPATALNPLENIQIAVTRQPLDGSKPAKRPEESLDLATALNAYIRNAAYVAREDGIDGTLGPGKAADLVILDHDLFRMNALSLHQARVLLTLLDGEPVYRDKRLSWPVTHHQTTERK
jgi:predicted amidohydrolase YtcJ